jgi:DNA-binding response OmpR family regulator
MGDRILLVEDELNLQHALKLNLELEGYFVQVCGTGTEAVKTFRDQKFDLVILDIMLPEMDGLMVCENIRLYDNHIPVLFLSAKNTAEDRINGLKKGADDYLTKPFELEELILRVQKLLQKSKQISNGQYFLCLASKTSWTSSTGKWPHIVPRVPANTLTRMSFSPQRSGWLRFLGGICALPLDCRWHWLWHVP